MTIERGVCSALFIYDIAQAINLDEAERQIAAGTQRERLQRKRPAPSYFEYHPAPVRVTQTAKSLGIGNFSTQPTVDLVLFDFGAVLVIYSIPLTGSLDDLLTLSEALYDNALLLADSRQRVGQLVHSVQAALIKSEISELVEDYIIFHIEHLQPPCSLEELCTSYGLEIARILRAERQPLSAQETTDALSHRLSFGADDIVVVDWLAALLIDRQGEDVRSVLEFANVELLEMRYLDQRLDDALDRSYETLLRRLWGPRRVGGSYRRDLHYVARLQVDSAVLFEGVNNALKLVGDQYLARVYRAASQRFHLAEWDTSILRKLQTLESIYEKMVDQATTRRMEVLEWIIIVLIAVSIVLPFLPGFPQH